MSYTLPLQDGKWKVGNNGFADIVQTRNIDFDETGVLRLARNSIGLYTSTEDSDFGFVKAIVNDYIFTSGNVFLLTPSTGAIAEKTAGVDLLSTATDAVYYAGEYCASAATSVYSYDGATTWTSRVTGLASVPHPLCVFENRRTLCIGNGNVVWQSEVNNFTQDSSNTATLPLGYYVTWLRSRGGTLFIGTRNIVGGHAKVFIWNGAGVIVQAGYSVGGDWAFSGADYKDTLVTLSSSGQLLRFNGGGFDELAHFPVYETPYSWSKSNAAAASTAGRCENRGMIADGETLYINIDGAVQGNPDITYLHSQPSGLWAYDPYAGLHHVAGYNYSKYTTLTITALGDNILTVGTHLLETGDVVRATSVSNITGLTTNRDYYAIRVSSTTIKLATSASDAYAGRSLTLYGTPSGDTLAANGIGRGGVQVVTPGAVALISDTSGFSRFFGSNILFSGRIPNAANTTISSVMSLGAGRNTGHFITSQFPASGAKDVFQKLCLYTKGIILDTESIVVKYRTSEKFGLPTPARYADSGLATWVDGTTFTVLTTTKDVMSAAVGDEVEIVAGAGAGYTAHITDIDSKTPTWTFIVDETIPNITAGDLSEVMINNWKKIGTITNTTDTIADDYAEVPIGDKASWMQFKVELRGNRTPISKLAIITETDKTV